MSLLISYSSWDVDNNTYPHYTMPILRDHVDRQTDIQTGDDDDHWLSDDDARLLSLLLSALRLISKVTTARRKDHSQQNPQCDPVPSSVIIPSFRVLN